MQLRRVSVVGGGPGGLYAARLLKIAQPGCEVVVHEQGTPDTTFGFGVGLAAGTQRNLLAADPDSLRDIVAAGYRHDMQMRVRGQVSSVRNDALIGVARTELLLVLQDHARRAGVQLRFGERVSGDDLDADLVVAADGVSSPTRDRHAEAFGARVTTGAGLYLWAGTDFALPHALFEPVETEAGTFVTHAYPYRDDRSTFLVETDADTLDRAGLTPPDDLPWDADDEASLRHLEGVFADALQGHRLIGNRTRWMRFRTVHADRWHVGRTVLLGDAAHTAHYSIGSGTKLAMEDAIELVASLQGATGLPEALEAYERVRRPAVARLQEVARRSQLWWESFPDRLDVPVDRLMVAYMSRAGNVPLARFAATSPDVVHQALADYAGTDPVDVPAGPDQVVDWVLDRPVETGGLELPTRRPDPGQLPEAVDVRDAGAGDLATLVCPSGDAWSAAGDEVVRSARTAAAASVAGLLLQGSDDRPAVLDRLDVAERVRSATGLPTLASVPADLADDAAAALVSARLDAVVLTGGPARAG
ncbi:FAD-dependent monooxygenase [Klenkia taihuensis]|uniref:Anthraniloyl-CoA monooxygenase n=1 Tax=Klenkia taihuensis TaxID=1225127 RepID=A0A1I1NV44_9ACTN|nr:FAD-dependent monooxygenase [Klenkia taihuensis]GHE11677.1 hypothetical protein GCM10011381_26070 [Klenkia taihuensis]SFD01479.1 anthraniloyl-CoA monooxygenase [Klenkia taihuensis]